MDTRRQEINADQKDANSGTHTPVPDDGKERPAGNENSNPTGNPNDVGTAGDYSR
jgi:hypothetical protein